MTINDPMALLLAYETKSHNGHDLDKSELKFAFKMLASADKPLSSKAAMVLTEQENPVLQEILDNFDNYRLVTRKTLVTLLACTQYAAAYAFLLDQLKTKSDKQLTSHILACLVHTDYFLFPILAVYLRDQTPRFREKLKIILARRGFRRIEPMLSMMTTIPNERLFREVFGDLAIERVKAD
ncbi:MAG: hypothetical protein ACI9BD_000199 [Candidatus Marinamargulisbacteria bacterium]|jgi:hypothetical protein